MNRSQYKDKLPPTPAHLKVIDRLVSEIHELGGDATVNRPPANRAEARRLLFALMNRRNQVRGY
jgi:hypothetical protein